MILYSNGCSFTQNYEIDADKRYPALLAKHFDWDLKSAGIPGSCNDRIIRCTIRDCIQLKDSGQEILALIQLTYPSRTEYAGTITETNQWKYAPGDLFESINSPDESTLPDVNNYMKFWMRLFDYDAAIEELHSNIIGLTGFLKTNGIKYIIFNGPKSSVSKKNSVFLEYLNKDNGVLDLSDFYMLKLLKEHKHPDEQGMHTIADYFIGLYEQELSKDA